MNVALHYMKKFFLLLILAALIVSSCELVDYPQPVTQIPFYASETPPPSRTLPISAPDHLAGTLAGS